MGRVCSDQLTMSNGFQRASVPLAAFGGTLGLAVPNVIELPDVRAAYVHIRV
jgi:hypothetical protein